MAVRFSITIFLAAIILFASVIVLVNVAIIIWGLAASSFSSLSSWVKARRRHHPEAKAELQLHQVPGQYGGRREGPYAILL